ncbi:MAG: hypothetical protein Q4A01_02655 [Coriobacteriales bacterium]|nr:hypothetical protein [Coriobacteriales bacterium]
MTNVAMQDRLEDALAKLGVIVAICASDADINSCHDGLSLLADNVFEDVAEVLQSLKGEPKADEPTA